MTMMASGRPASPRIQWPAVEQSQRRHEEGEQRRRPEAAKVDACGRAQALACYEHLLWIEPDSADGWIMRGAAPSELQRNEEAVQASQGAGGHVTNPDKIGYLLAALGSEAMPAASPVQYVRDLFDKYARRFDDQLVSQLNYRVPELLAAQLQPLVEATGLGVLELGCGTGLCRPWLKPWAGSLTGPRRVREDARGGGAQRRLRPPRRRRGQCLSADV
jgi:predicted TPR repeat methyltransferase